MKVKLINCYEEWVEFDIGKLKDINLIWIDVLSGDEVMTVYYKKGGSKTFDSDKHMRSIDFLDCSYVAYQPGVVNKFKSKKWRKRDFNNYTEFQQMTRSLNKTDKRKGKR